ncbi:MAG: pyridoxamine 5'-phosphate oxidase family protein [Desulfosalsimonadaceae bacterium]
MRRNDRAISVEYARRLLETAEDGVLSMASSDNVPNCIPMNFLFVRDCIYFHCAPEDKKISLLSSNRKVSFCVVGRTEMLPEKFGMKYESVVAAGIVEELFEKDKREGLILRLNSAKQVLRFMRGDKSRRVCVLCFRLREGGVNTEPAAI